MNLFARGFAALLVSVTAFAATAATKPKAPRGASVSGSTQSAVTTPQREKISYVVGFDIAQSIAPVAPDLDMAAFERAIRNAFAGQKPLLTEAQGKVVGQALMQRIGTRKGQAPAGTKAPEVSRQDVGYLVGADIGRSLAPIKDEVDLALVLQSISASFAGRPARMDEATRNAVREQFIRELQAKQQARAAAMATTNQQQGSKFLAENKAKTGVFTTPSGLQYMVLRQGAGIRPKPSDRVRVNYQGALLDGTVFDSSYERGQPVDFMLNQVIPGWTEGLAMMPVGAKYRFWIPSSLGYGEKGAGDRIGPNATLVFDVELLAISQ
ncbi:MAG: FKBP-type peptidyl-prolyl cis-trans isomerase [Lysobacter sp.]|nr:MAG: FKBP-type peptidyl-prolyl cis-trans isomerase [Lysobacter sp.]